MKKEIRKYLDPILWALGFIALALLVYGIIKALLIK